MHLRKRCEQLLQLRWGHPDPGVFDGGVQRHGVVRGRAAQRDADVTTVRELQRVADDVQQDLAEPAAITHHDLRHPRIGIDVHREPAGTGVGGERVHDPLHGFAYRERCVRQVDTASLDLRVIQDVVDDAQQIRRGIVHHLQGAGARRRVLHAVLQYVDHAQHTGHRCADFVAHHGQERGLRLIGRFGGVPRLGQTGDQIFVGELQADALAVVAMDRAAPDPQHRDVADDGQGHQLHGTGRIEQQRDALRRR